MTHSVRHSRTLLATLLAMTIGTAVANDRAEARYRALPMTPVERTVTIRDLDLSSDRDIKTLYGRLSRAARIVCDANRSYPTAYIRAVLRPCVNSALDRAVVQVESPALTAYHEKTSSKSRLARVHSSTPY